MQMFLANLITALAMAMLCPLTVAVAVSECRCYPGDSCWPTPHEWHAFNATVDGRLVKTVPLAHVCHDPTYQERACRALRLCWTVPETHIETSHSLMVPVFANHSCSPWAERHSPCDVGAYVQYAVSALTSEHVAKTIDFVRANNIRLVIRNTGHDYLGKSSGPGSLALWTHHIKSLELVDWHDRIYQGQAIKLGAGVQGSELIDFAAKYNLTALTGNCPSVGIAGGYIQGGGHSALSSKYGLAADQLLEIELVDASGAYKVVNRRHDPNLFWALSGGGAGTFAVVLSVTVRAYPDLPSATATLEFAATDVGQAVFLDGVKLFQAMIPALHDAGCSSVYIFTSQIFQLRPLMCHGMSKSTVQKLLHPFTSGLDNLHIAFEYNTTDFAKWSDRAREGWLDDGQPYQVNQIQAGTWLVPRTAILDPVLNAQAVDAVLRLQDLGANVGMQTMGPSKAVAAATDNAVFPGWRDAALLVWVIVPGDDSLPMERLLQNQRRLSEVMMPIIQSAHPDGGAYLNEADPLDVGWKRNSYGANYERLLTIKQKHDPDGIFYARHAVGSDAWVEKHDGRLCRALVREPQEEEL